MTVKRLRVAVVMDPIEDIKPAKDTTLAMMLAGAYQLVQTVRPLL